jgi:hypothetical protein
MEKKLSGGGAECYKGLKGEGRKRGEKEKERGMEGGSKKE